MSLLLLFFLMVGLGSTLKIEALKERIKKPKGICIGMFSQFIFMPFFCWALTKVFNLSDHYALALQIIGCCPGGALSNTLCYVFQTDITLSIAMTTASSMVALVMLFFNCYIYVEVISDMDIKFDWVGMVMGVAIVVLGTLIGVKMFSERFPEYTLRTEKMANWAMVAIIMGALVANNFAGGLLGYPTTVYVASCLPSIAGSAVGLGLSLLLGLPKPSAFAVAIETAVQNQLLALTIITLTIKDSELRNKAYGVPVIYAFFAFFWGFALCYAAFRMGWTNAPADMSVWNAFWDYRQRRREEVDAIILLKAQGHIVCEVEAVIDIDDCDTKQFTSSDATK